MASAFSSCVDTEKPVFQEPTTFIVNTPPLQNEYLATTGDMDDKSTFNLVCSQPDYGFAAKANYNAQVSMTGEFKDAVTDADGNVVTAATYYSISNQDTNNASMSLRTYDLAVAMCSLLDINSPEDWSNYLANGGATDGLKVYLRATCEIAGVSNSFIASQNVVSYNNVSLEYAVPTAGFIYIVGNVSGWSTPAAANKDFYEDFKLYEPEIGSKIYAGTFTMPATSSVSTADPGTVDYTTQWRFYTDLVGWDDTTAQIASNEANFYIVDVTGDFSNGAEYGSSWTGEGVYGQGNWGVCLEADTEMTFAVSLVDKNKPQVWVRYGKWDVSVGLNASGIKEPVFTEPAAE